jgi:ubiquinone biosynthesis protein
VVVNRTGVRRDLLAMRPVADLTRRRLGDRLPLVPSEAVAEFAAHASHRRDMYFAAQICRRLKRIEGLQLRVPDVFRGYSTARCITFEAPADPAPPGEAHYRLVAETLVRLALGEGIFLADPAPKRFILGGPTGEVWLADPTEVFALDPERLRGVAEVLAAVRRGDVDGIVRALPLAGSYVPREDSVLRRELRETSVRTPLLKRALVFCHVLSGVVLMAVDLSVTLSGNSRITRRAPGIGRVGHSRCGHNKRQN